jgi:multicomponent Na+:H+ antiporter subunit G
VNWFDYVTIVAIALGCFFFLAGTVGLVRFPDVYTRLHALTKADNIGLGLIILGALFQIAFQESDEISMAANIVKLILTWILVLITSATVAHLIARSARLHNQPIWQKGEDNNDFD